MFGDFPRAVVHVRCLLNLLTTNDQGYFALPEHFEGTAPSGTLTAEEGTAALVMNLVMLWQRLCHAALRARDDFGPHQHRREPAFLVPQIFLAQLQK